MAIDTARYRLFTGCRKRSDGGLRLSGGQGGRHVSDRHRCRRSRYDAASGNAFASKADGTLTVIHQDAPDQYQVIENVRTPQAVRNMGLDPTNHRVFVVSARFGPVPAGAPGRAEDR
jgi:hypothetical protein